MEVMLIIGYRRKLKEKKKKKGGLFEITSGYIFSGYFFHPTH